MIDWSTCPAAESDPERVSGAWVFRGTRVPVSALFENLEGGASVHDFTEWFQGVTSEQVRVVLEHVAKSALAPAQVKVFFDQGTPAPLRHFLAGHDVETAYERGWSQTKNGALIAAMEQAGFGVFVTTDQNLKYQQNLAGRKVAIVVILTTNWSRIRADVKPVLAAVNSATPGSYIEVAVAGAA